MIFVIDNYDSFTWNLVQYFGELGQEAQVARNDEVGLDEIAALKPEALVISPGPCTPAEAGISVDSVRRFAGRLPVLGVCLGHQAIAVAWGGKLREVEPMHGKLSEVHHGADGLFADLPNPLVATRYHSLVASPESLPDELVVDAWTHSEGAAEHVMALHHRSLPVWGLQFHPESILTLCGKELLANFLRLAKIA